MMMASKLCDSCKSATAALFCRPDSAFLCLNCDSKIHTANKLASRHPRVWVCEVCEQAPAHVTCKADAANLCISCDRDIHSANPLARRHERLPVVPFYDSSHSHSLHHNHNNSTTPVNFHLDDRYFSDADGGIGGGGGGGDVSREEAEAASWLLPNPPPPHHQHQHQQKVFSESPDLNSGQYMFSSEMDPYLDLEYGPTVDPKLEAQEQNSSGTDGVVPVQSKSTQAPFEEEEEEDYHLDFAATGGSKPHYDSLHLYSHHLHGYKYYHPSAGLSHSVSSSSLEVGVVPDGSAMADVSNPYGNNNSSSGRAESTTVQLSAVDREARVLRYREKRKNRKFEKTIRYASRKAYAETRPRIKGRFAKRSDTNEEVDVVDRTTSSTSSASIYAAFGVVPSF